ncbi:MAG: ATP-binding protein [Candidatus Shapirobacteria bacterium]|jgi:signal transduction histidine kinase
MADTQLSADERELLLAKANEEIYKQNFELSLRNKTLSILKILYSISISTLDVNEVSQQIVDTIAAQMNFPAVLISLVDPDGQSLRPSAITKSESIQNAISIINKPLSELIIPLDYRNNLVVNAVKTNERQITSNLLDILDPLVPQDPADAIAKIVNINTLIIYPLSINNKAIGAMTLGISKEIDDLSRGEKETLDQLIDVVSIAIDRARLHQNLKLANDHLKELDKLKDEFVSLASHELRTPMTAIKGYVWMVQNGKAGDITDTAKKYLEIVYSSTERLIHLVNDMLDISRIESGRFQLHPETFDFSELVTQIQTEFSAKASEHQMTWHTDIDPSQISINADKDKILQILENLVGNAFKFTPDQGFVSLQATVKDNFLRVSISDSGRGIAAEDIPKLFTKFTRLGEGLPTLAKPGTGLGLYLSKQFVELHHGQVFVESELNKGSTFTFTIPLV